MKNSTLALVLLAALTLVHASRSIRCTLSMGKGVEHGKNIQLLFSQAYAFTDLF